VKARQRSIRNLLATTLLATGVPMLNAGDELGRSQRGNNNAYCQDNELAWFDWDLQPWQRDLLATARFLTRLRATQPVLRQRSFFTGRPAHADGTADLEWYSAEGQRMHHAVWDDPRLRTLTMFLDGTPLEADSLLVVFHGGAAAAEVTLPGHAGVTAYELLWDSAWDLPRAGGKVEPGPVEVSPASVQVYVIRL
jgi:isoamylase